MQQEKFTGENPFRSAISIKLICNFIEIALRHGCSPVNFLHIFRTPFARNTFGWLLLSFTNQTYLSSGFRNRTCVSLQILKELCISLPFNHQRVSLPERTVNSK